MLIAPFWNVFAQYDFIVRMVDPRLWPLIRLFSPDIKHFEKIDFIEPDHIEEIERIFDNIDFSDPDVREFITGISILFSVVDQIKKAGSEAINIAPNIEQPTLIIQDESHRVVSKRFTAKLV